MNFFFHVSMYQIQIYSSDSSRVVFFKIRLPLLLSSRAKSESIFFLLTPTRHFTDTCIQFRIKWIKIISHFIASIIHIEYSSLQLPMHTKQCIYSVTSYCCHFGSCTKELKTSFSFSLHLLVSSYGEARCIFIL
jgi:hypothetical protein